MKKWGGQLDIRPPHSKNWGGRVPPIPPRIDAPANVQISNTPPQKIVTEMSNVPNISFLTELQLSAFMQLAFQ